VFFTTDHGTHVTGEGNKFHGDLGEPVVRVPLVVIPPEGQMKQLQANVGSPVAHADLLATSLDLMGISPVKPIDGLSLRKPIPDQRLRVTTSYVITLHNDPVAALDVAGRERFDVNFEQNSVTNSQGQVMPYATWVPEYRAVFESKR
jgi:arylsulfatase A-like enzyme